MTTKDHSAALSGSGAPLARALQFGDSMFPVGGFAFSGGLESAIQKRVVTDAETLHAYARTAVEQAAMGDGIALVWAYRAAAMGDIAEVSRIDERVYARKLSGETRTSADVLYRLRRERVHFHAHRHADGVAHFHAHSHRAEVAPHDPARHEHPHGFPARALLVGMVHGMAGSAALVLLSLEALRSPAWGLLYIAIFGLGSMLGMAVLSAAIAVPLRLSSRHLTRAHGGLSAAVGLATLVVGCYIVYRVGTGDVMAGS